MSVVLIFNFFVFGSFKHTLSVSLIFDGAGATGATLHCFILFFLGCMWICGVALNNASVSYFDEKHEWHS